MLRHSLAGGLGVEGEDLENHGVVVTSAGTDAPEGHPASRRGITFAADRGVSLGSHAAAQLTARAVAAADIIYCMDKHQVAAVASLDPSCVTKAMLLAGEGVEIPDPHHESDQFFYDVALRIERAVAHRTPELLDVVRSPPSRE